MSFFQRGRRRRLTPLIAGAATAVLGLTALTGCGSGADGEVSASGEAEVKLGVIPIIDIAPVKLGISKGVFARHKLNVTTQDAQGGAAIVPAVVSGDFQFGYSNLVSLLVAREKGVPVTMVSVGARASDDPVKDGSGQLMTANPGIAKVGDLKGKKIAINTLKGINEVAVASVLKKNGLAKADVTLVEVPIPNMPAALKSGQVDAAMLSEPFITVTKGQGARPLPVSYAAMGANLPFAELVHLQAVRGQEPRRREALLRRAEGVPPVRRAAPGRGARRAERLSEAGAGAQRQGDPARLEPGGRQVRDRAARPAHRRDRPDRQHPSAGRAVRPVTCRVT
ncbi:ABC transporter substrate-binding protein [Actinomadura luteofluorescens]